MPGPVERTTLVRDLIEDSQPEVKMGLDTLELNLRRLEESAKAPTWQPVAPTVATSASLIASGTGYAVLGHGIAAGVVIALGAVAGVVAGMLAVRARRAQKDRVTTADIVEEYRSRLST